MVSGDTDDDDSTVISNSFPAASGAPGTLAAIVRPKPAGCTASCRVNLTLS